MRNIALIPRETTDTKGYIDHIHQEGARFHVLHWNSNGTHCSERDCVVNKSDKENKLNDIIKKDIKKRR